MCPCSCAFSSSIASASAFVRVCLRMLAVQPLNNRQGYVHEEGAGVQRSFAEGHCKKEDAQLCDVLRYDIPNRCTSHDTSAGANFPTKELGFEFFLGQ